MVATRSGAKKAPEVAAATSTTNNSLKAPPKRAGKRKAVEDAPSEPPRKAAKPTKAEPKAKKPAAKTATKAAPKKAAATRTRATAKIVEKVDPVEPVEEKPEPIEEAIEVEEPKVAKRTVRGRKPAAAAAPATIVKELVKEIAKEAEEPAMPEEPAVTEPVRRATRGRKPSAKQPTLKASSQTLASTTITATRATRGRKTTTTALAPAAADSPLKKPARKPAGRKAKVTEKTDSAAAAIVIAAVKEPFTEHPNYPNTPAHITAAFANHKAFAELPENYPKTPAHIAEAFGNQNALKELPEDYPKTPAHIAEAFDNKNALNELPDYPKTPAHIASALRNQTALDALPTEYPKTPGHVASAMRNQKALNELPEEYPKTPAHLASALRNQKAFDNLPAEYPKTPSHITDAAANRDAMAEMPEYPKTPAHIEAALANQNGFDALPVDYPKTPEYLAAALSNKKALKELPAEYPKTPVHIAAPLVSQNGFKEPSTETPKTPVLTIEQGFAALPSYPTTPKDIELSVQQAIQDAMSTPVDEQTPTAREPLRELALSEVATLSEDSQPDPMEVDGPSFTLDPAVTGAKNITFAPLEAPTLAAPVPASPSKRSALRSPVKADLKTPKKTVTWNDEEETTSESEFLLYDGPLRGMNFFVDVTSNGKDQSFLFTTLLEDMGAQVLREWTDSTSLSHVLFKDGKKSTLEKVVASDGKVKCVNVGWVLDSEKNKERMDEAPYLVDLASTKALSPPKPKQTPYTPAKTPSKFFLNLQDQSSSVKSVPSTPTSSEFDRSINYDDKENSEIGIFFQDQAKSVPPAKKSWLLNKSPIKTPSKPNFLHQTPMKAFSTTKKRTANESFGGIKMAPAKKLRLF